MGEVVAREIPIPSDEDGYVLLQCEHCNSFFKITPSDFEDDEVLSIHCPFCGLISDSYITDDVRELAMTMANNMANEMIHNMFKDLERSLSNNKFVKFKAGKKRQDEYESPIRSITDSLTVKEYSCCHRKAKISKLMKMSVSYCPFCGVIDFED